MGALWNLAAVALSEEELFERFVARGRRSPGAASRVAATLAGSDTRRIVTCSRSAVVEAVIRATRLPVLCAEGRPGLEGRRLAESLAREANPVQVTLTSDAAIASDLQAGDLVLVGADAIAARWFINKAGTRQLCAAALLAGVPAYVVSGREKCVPPAIASSLTLRADVPATLWEGAPVGIRVVNPLFERIPVDLVAGVITDVGVLADDMIRAACDATVPPQAADALVDLLTALSDPDKAE
jgi:translation initiation factor 2B subunit (eIF-2B alpha/beta/delta family)